jgi:signal transduction histidine kinase
MKLKENKVEFTAILASSVHDMKNSLGMLLSMLDDAIEYCTEEKTPVKTLLSQIEYEAKRINYELIQLLSIYSLGNDQYTPNITHNSVSELIEELVVQNRFLFEFKGIAVSTDCPPDICWFFDKELVLGVLNSVINNAFRYTKGRLRISATEAGEFIRLSVEDDGTGYPKAILEDSKRIMGGISFTSGSTGLGLYFSSMVADYHKNKGKSGYIELVNGGEYGGGCFNIYLP